MLKSAILKDMKKMMAACRWLWVQPLEPTHLAAPKAAAETQRQGLYPHLGTGIITFSTLELN